MGNLLVFCLRLRPTHSRNPPPMTRGWILLLVAAAAGVVAAGLPIDDDAFGGLDDFEVLLELPKESKKPNADKIYDNLDDIKDPRDKSLVLPLPAEKYETQLILGSPLEKLNLDQFEESLGRVLQVHPERIVTSQVKPNGATETVVAFEIVNNSTFSEINSAEAQQLLSQLVSQSPDTLADAIGAPVVGVSLSEDGKVTKSVVPPPKAPAPSAATNREGRSGIFGKTRIKVFRDKPTFKMRLPVARRSFNSEPGRSWVSFWDKQPEQGSFTGSMRCESVCGHPPPPEETSFFEVDQTACVLNGGDWQHSQSTCQPFMAWTSKAYTRSEADSGACVSEFGNAYDMCDTVQALSLASLHSAVGGKKSAATTRHGRGAAGMQVWVRSSDANVNGTVVGWQAKMSSLVPRCDAGNDQYSAVRFGSAAATDHATCLAASTSASTLCCRASNA